MSKTITAAPVERDSRGFWTHPDFFVPANGNEFGVEGEFDAWKAFNRVTGAIGWMECEENADELQSAYDAGDCDLSMWQPTQPNGDGWFMASIHETEEGPVCYWLRPLECDPEALAAHIDKCYAEAFHNIEELGKPVAWTDAEELAELNDDTFANIFNGNYIDTADGKWLPLYSQEYVDSLLAELEQMRVWKKLAAQRYEKLQYLRTKLEAAEARLLVPVKLPKTNGYWDAEEQAFERGIQLACQEIRAAGFLVGGGE